MAGLAFHTHVPALGLGQGFDNGQAQAGPAGETDGLGLVFPGAAGVAPIKTVEKMGQIRRGDAGSAVGDVETDEFRIAIMSNAPGLCLPFPKNHPARTRLSFHRDHCQMHCAARWAVPKPVAHQVVQDLVDSVRVPQGEEGGGGGLGGGLGGDANGALFGQGAEDVGHVGHHVFHGQMLHDQGQTAGLGLGQLVEVLDQPGEDTGFVVDGGDLGLLQGVDAVEQGLEIALDHAERGAQFVGDVGHHALAQALLAVQVGGHAVEAGGQLADLVPAVDGYLGVQLALGDLHHPFFQGAQGLEHAVGQQAAHQQRHQSGHHGGDDQGMVHAVQKGHFRRTNGGLDGGLAVPGVHDAGDLDAVDPDGRAGGQHCGVHGLGRGEGQRLSRGGLDHKEYPTRRGLVHAVGAASPLAHADSASAHAPKGVAGLVQIALDALPGAGLGVDQGGLVGHPHQPLADGLAQIALIGGRGAAPDQQTDRQHAHGDDQYEGEKDFGE